MKDEIKTATPIGKVRKLIWCDTYELKKRYNCLPTSHVFMHSRLIQTLRKQIYLIIKPHLPDTPSVCKPYELLCSLYASYAVALTWSLVGIFSLKLMHNRRYSKSSTHNALSSRSLWLQVKSFQSIPYTEYNSLSKSIEVSATRRGQPVGTQCIP